MPQMPKRSSLLVPLSVAAVLGGAGGAAATLGLDRDSGRTVTVTQSPAGSAVASDGAATTADTTSPVAETSGTPLTATQIYQRSKDAVAFITATVTQESSSPFGPQQESGTATGTGFAISKDGLIVTNAHVIDGARSIRVKVGDRDAVSATVVGVDTSTDVALLRIDTHGDSLPTLSFGDSSKVQVGDGTFAIGNPYGLDRTLTTGVVSALHRSIDAPDGYAISDVLQTDAALNPGNSGGPLLDTSGRVIGINSQIESSGSSQTGETGGNTGVGFAVPANTAKRVVEQLKATGKATHPYLGVSTQDSATGTAGARVAAVSSGGPAGDAGVQPGDVITRLAGQAVDDAEALTSVLEAHRPGEKVAVQVLRGGQTRTLTVTLGTRPARATTQAG